MVWLRMALPLVPLEVTATDVADGSVQVGGRRRLGVGLSSARPLRAGVPRASSCVTKSSKRAPPVLWVTVSQVVCDSPGVTAQQFRASLGPWFGQQRKRFGTAFDGARLHTSRAFANLVCGQVF